MSVCSLKIFVYDGKTGEKVCALGGGKAHDGGIYAVSITSFLQMICSISLPSSWTMNSCNNKCTYHLVVTFVFLQISWSPDSSQLLSASGDKTAKIWDVGANSVVSTFNMGSNVLDQQLGCLWQKNHLLTISLSGYINYLDKNNPNKPLRVIKVG